LFDSIFLTEQLYIKAYFTNIVVHILGCARTLDLTFTIKHLSFDTRLFSWLNKIVRFFIINQPLGIQPILKNSL